MVMVNKEEKTINPDERDQEFLQERYVEMQLIEKQAEQLRQQLQFVEQQVQDVRNSAATLDEIAKLKPGEEAMIPIANGVFTRGTITDTKRLLVGVGGQVVVEKDIPSTKKILDIRLASLNKSHGEIMQIMMQLDARAQQIQGEMQKIITKYQ